MIRQNTVPVMLMAFIRPDLLRKCLQHLEKFAPPLLYVMSDGPRNEIEAVLCEQSRNLALSPGWKCEVIPIFNDQNEGIVRSFVKGMNLMFSDHEYGIYLEDDIMLSPSFYQFAQEVLIKYKDEPKVGHINATNIAPQYFNRNGHSYHLGNYTTEWGFATWRRVWKSYDVSMPQWEETNQNKLLKKTTFNSRSRNSLKRMFDLHCNNPAPLAWGYQWHFNCLENNYLSITPARNMSLNLGFERDDSTNTFGKNPIANQIEEVVFPLHHPRELKPDALFDKLVENIMCPSYSKVFTGKLLKKIKKLSF
jgi:hypothetical protein